MPTQVKSKDTLYAMSQYSNVGPLTLPGTETLHLFTNITILVRVLSSPNQF